MTHLPFTAQVWSGQTLLSEIAGLSIEAAREIASHALPSQVGRIICEAADYCEVYDNPPRYGTFGETTLVRFSA